MRIDIFIRVNNVGNKKISDWPAGPINCRHIAKSKAKLSESYANESCLKQTVNVCICVYTSIHKETSAYLCVLYAYMYDR